MDPGYTTQWGLGAANFPDAWQTTTGSRDMTTCVLDTGVDATHPDLAPSMTARVDGQVGFNAMLAGGTSADDVGHGTHVAGILGAVGGNGTGITGAARTNVLPVKVMDAHGGKESDLTQGITWCATHGGNIALMSLHIDKSSPSVARAVTFAQERGLLVVASAGNAGATTIAYPAAYPGVLSVGAVTPSGALAGFSNHATSLDLVAPGYRIASTRMGGGYVMGSGTSQAAPFVAAAATLVWATAPTLTAQEVQAILVDSARDFGAPGTDATFGHGALDAGAAVERSTAG